MTVLTTHEPESQARKKSLATRFLARASRSCHRGRAARHEYRTGVAGRDAVLAGVANRWPFRSCSAGRLSVAGFSHSLSTVGLRCAPSAGPCRVHQMHQGRDEVQRYTAAILNPGPQIETRQSPSEGERKSNMFKKMISFAAVAGLVLALAPASCPP